MLSLQVIRNGTPSPSHPQTESQVLAICLKDCIVKLNKFQMRGAAEVNYSTDEIWAGLQLANGTEISCHL